MNSSTVTLLAKCLRAERPDYELPACAAAANRMIQWNKDVSAIAKVCFASNQNYYHQVFYADCGGLFGVEDFAKSGRSLQNEN